MEMKDEKEIRIELLMRMRDETLVNILTHEINETYFRRELLTVTKSPETEQAISKSTSALKRLNKIKGIIEEMLESEKNDS